MASTWFRNDLPRAPAGDHADPLVTSRFETPVGPMVCAAIEAGVCLLEFSGRRALPAELRDLQELLDRPLQPGDRAHPGRHWLAAMERELGTYFAGSLRKFTVPLVTPGTQFEQRVWRELLEIPYAQTRSYGQMAVAVNAPGGARAVGRANGRNRIAIVIPCHRVIEAGGGLRGYGGGLERKRFLLDLERRLAGIEPGLFDA
jgi:AraC family transcriptional regulator of adaptative response/methylated-DNA-[protein]-cysteine methyltransferase